MKTGTNLILILLLLALLVGCAGETDVATSSNAEPLAPAASADDVRPAPTLLNELLDGGGAWRSEQQAPEDAGVIVRMLELGSDGSFFYREGDYASEFSYFARGSWQLDGQTLTLRGEETDELGTSAGAAVAVTLEAAVADGMLTLTQRSEAGLCGSPAGQTVYYYHPTES